MPNLHPPDWLLIVKVPTDHAGTEIDSPRDRRCWELAELIAAEQGLTITAAA